MAGKQLGMAVVSLAVVLSMLVLLAVVESLSSLTIMKYQDEPNAVALTTKATSHGQEGLELLSTSDYDFQTQLRAHQSKSKKGKGKRAKKAKKAKPSGKKSKRAYKINFPKYAVIAPNEVTYTSSATDRKGQIVVEDWKQG